ncbi:hypothetical protein Nepgr_004766 [Nepenthes gracilis]|uniref:Uncharacterized protein n=1 Tax=Nepenthes gracilis TaxID=150966 RepID=A0AAD3S274_NEPGR|nr:hypothetical protein Nepgr_004766 [Nepenthes gracilis]
MDFNEIYVVRLSSNDLEFILSDFYGGPSQRGLLLLTGATVCAIHPLDGIIVAGTKILPVNLPPENPNPVLRSFQDFLGISSNVMFRKLLKMADEGKLGNGPIRLSYNRNFVEHALLLVHLRVSQDVEKACITSMMTCQVVTPTASSNV